MDPSPPSFRPTITPKRSAVLVASTPASFSFEFSPLFTFDSNVSPSQYFSTSAAGVMSLLVRVGSVLNTFLINVCESLLKSNVAVSVTALEPFNILAVNFCPVPLLIGIPAPCRLVPSGNPVPPAKSAGVN